MCENITKNQYIFADDYKLRHSEFLITMFQQYLPLYQISDECQPILNDLYCHYLFPLCDTTLERPHARRICRKTCEFALEVKCKKESAALRKIADLDQTFDKNMINCTAFTFSTAEGGQAPECYQYHTSPGE